MNNHKFKVGQTVNYTPRFIGTVNADAIFKITQLLPPEDDEFQYRIRSVLSGAAMQDAAAALGGLPFGLSAFCALRLDAPVARMLVP